MSEQMEMEAPERATVYGQYPEVFEKIKSGGWPNICEVSKIVYSLRELDAIVSKSFGAVSHWLIRPVASSITEKRAKAYLENLNKPVPTAQPVLQLVPVEKPKPKTATFMVKVPTEYLDKWAKLAKLLTEAGGEVEDF